MSTPTSSAPVLAGFQAFILSKNEAPNILRGVLALEQHGASVTVLDSGSTDETGELLARDTRARVIAYPYVSHVGAYTDILLKMAPAGSAVGIFDADMVVPGELAAELASLLRRNDWDVVKAPVDWWSEAIPIPHASLYPPKPIVFRAGVAWMAPRGHGEAPVPHARVVLTRNTLVHDDRKGLPAFLQSQVRYAGNMLQRARIGRLGWRDWIRTRTPVMIGAAPAFILVAKRGFRDGLPAYIYALDRLVAETIFLREALAERLREQRDRQSRK